MSHGRNAAVTTTDHGKSQEHGGLGIGKLEVCQREQAPEVKGEEE